MLRGIEGVKILIYGLEEKKIEVFIKFVGVFINVVGGVLSSIIVASRDFFIFIDN